MAPRNLRPLMIVLSHPRVKRADEFNPEADTWSRPLDRNGGRQREEGVGGGEPLPALGGAEATEGTTRNPARNTSYR